VSRFASLSLSSVIKTVSSGYNVTKFRIVPSSLCTWYLFLRSEYLLVNFALTRPQYLTYKTIFNAVGMTRLKIIYEYERNLCRCAGFIKGKNKYVANVNHLCVPTD
jgi:hypothetical protein